MNQFDSAQPELIQLGRRRDAGGMLDRLCGGPMADKFFVVGALAGFFGMAGYGAHMWLMLSGRMTMAPSYPHLRELHAVIQFFLFFGAFVLGFALQAGPKLIGIPTRISRSALFLLPALLFGAILLPASSAPLVGRIIVSAVFLTTLFLFLRKVRTSDDKLHFHPVFFFGASLLGFASIAFVDLTQPVHSVLAFWVTVVPAIFAAGEQFLTNFAGGRRFVGRPGIALRWGFGGSVLLVLAAIVAKSSLLWTIWSGTAALLLLGYFTYSGAWRTMSRLLKGPLLLALAFGFSWSLIGVLPILMDGAERADLTLHLWAIGWATTLIIAVSAQVLGFLSGAALWSHRLGSAMITLWQVVPIGRGLGGPLALPGWFSWVVITAATVVLGVWVWMVLRAEIRIIAKQRALAKGEHLSSC